MSRVLKFEVPPGKPVLRGQDHFWKVILALDAIGPWSISELRARSNGVHRSTISEYVRRLVGGGFVVANEVGVTGTMYRLVRKQTTPPKLRRDGTTGLQGRGQVQMWNMIRGPMGRDGFTFKDVALYASTETVEVKPATASSYLKHLAEAGYLMCLRKGGPGTPAIYRLKPAMMTGILPPLILRSQIVFDQNRGEAIGPVVAREVVP